MKSIRSQVNARVFVVVIPLLLAVLVTGAYLLQRSVASAFYTGYQTDLLDELRTVEQALEHAFLVNDFQTVQKVVTTLSHGSRIQVVRIIDLNGLILASSISEEVGIHLDKQNQECLPCHTSKFARADDVQHVTGREGDERFILTANPLDNQIACQSCHATSGAALGVILADYTTSQVEARLANLTAGIYSGAGFLFLLLVGAFWLSYHRLVAGPLRSLSMGETDASLVTRRDEFGSLARQLQDLNEEVKEKGSQLDFQRRSFNALLTLSESIDATLTAEKVLQFAISKILEVTSYSAIAMRVFEPGQKCFRLVAQSGMSPRMLEDLRCIPAEIGFTGDVYKTHRAAYTSDLSADPRLESPSPVESGYHSLCSVPFLSGERLMGSMESATKEPHQWSESEVRWLELMGRSIGNVLHQIEISNQLQGLAVMQERSRIAQEIHDGLAQLIGTLRMWAEEAQLSLQRNNLREVQDDLQKIELTARDAYASLREEILGLRDTLLPGQGITPVLREFLSRYQRQWGLKTRLIIHPSPHDDQGFSGISPAAEIQLLRIVQEGLTNVRRHSTASQVSVSMEDGEELLRVEIKDNGQGFDPQNVPEEKLGLRIMRERAASVGGKISVQSSGKEGTRLTIELPKPASPA